MHAVLLTEMFERQAKRASLSDESLSEIVDVIAENPLAGDLIVGTGGARKLRHPGRGKGKSGGYRTIHYFGGEDIPVFLLALIDKGERANLSKAERDGLASILPRIVFAYRRRQKA